MTLNLFHVPLFRFRFGSSLSVIAKSEGASSHRLPCISYLSGTCGTSRTTSQFIQGFLAFHVRSASGCHSLSLVTGRRVRPCPRALPREAPRASHISSGAIRAIMPGQPAPHAPARVLPPPDASGQVPAALYRRVAACLLNGLTGCRVLCETKQTLAILASRANPVGQCTAFQGVM